MSFQEDDKDELDDSELPDAADMNDSHSTDTEACPVCGKMIYEQAQSCPHCGNLISTEHRRHRKPMWIVIGVILCLILALFICLR
jgi:predicted nucleic acid-binding Zn ribbon protein